MNSNRDGSTAHNQSIGTEALGRNGTFTRIQGCYGSIPMTMLVHGCNILVTRPPCQARLSRVFGIYRGCNLQDIAHLNHSAIGSQHNTVGWNDRILDSDFTGAGNFSTCGRDHA